MADLTPILTQMMRILLVQGRLAEAREILKALMLAIDEYERPDYETRCKAFQIILAFDCPSVLEQPRYG